MKKISLISIIIINVIVLGYFFHVTSNFVHFGFNFPRLNFGGPLKNYSQYFKLHNKCLLKDRYHSYDQQKDLDYDLLNLAVDQNDLASFKDNLPLSGFTERSAKLEYQNSTQSVDFRLRGGHDPHWAYGKNSLKISSKQPLYKGIKSFSLVVPKELRNYFSYYVAKQYDLHVPFNELVYLYINDQASGFYLLTQNLEDYLEKHIKNYILYEGESVSKELVYPILYYLELFSTPGAWTRKATRSTKGLFSFEEFANLINNLDRIDFTEYFDLDYLARFSAFEYITGCQHYDEKHNWKLVYIKNLNRLYPFAWDPSALRYNSKLEDFDKTPSKFHYYLFQDQEFLKLRSKYIKQYFEEKKDQELLEFMQNELNKISEAIQYDPNSCNFFDLDFIINNKNEYIITIEDRLNQIREQSLSGSL